MLAYNEKNRLKEFEDVCNLQACTHCRKIYRQVINGQIPGFREREHDICPYCGTDNGSSMSYEFSNSKISEEELKKLKKKSLIATVVKYCHEKYSTSSCGDCNHYNTCPGECQGNCKKCLEEVHFPAKYPLGKKDYDCERMLDFYVCDYTVKYTSEMLYLMRESEALKQIDNYHVISIGCGGCPDLMAFERYCHEDENGKSVNYIGIDVNKKWMNIHKVIKEYKTTTLRKAQFVYMDAVSEEYSEISQANVIVLQYVISHFYNTKQIEKISTFFDKLIQKIVTHKQKGKPFVVLINDVNSNNRGRDYFQLIIDKLHNEGFHGISKRFYFDYRIQNDFQRYGTRHQSTDILYNIPDELDIYQPWTKCSSAQLLIEVWEDDDV